MKQAALAFDAESLLGRVASVDTSRIWIDVENHALLTRVGVSQLIAVQGATVSEQLIGIVERITRNLDEQALVDEEDEIGAIPIGQTQRDLVRAVLIGTYRTVDGSSRDTFKRGADSFPQIDRQCHLIEGANLQALMNLISQDVPSDQRMELGTFLADGAARAVADGNRFFQRHAALLGSTGSGKSWAVALILEKANALHYPNVIVLDMHGEYGPLADSSSSGFAQYFRIASPADLEKPDESVLFLPYWLLNREEMLALLLDRSDSNAPNQASRFTQHVRDLKADRLKSLKRDDVLATFTVDSPVPYDITTLIEHLTADDNERVLNPETKRMNNGDWNGKLTRFVARLESKVEDRRYGFLFKPPSGVGEYHWLASMLKRMLCSGPETPGIKIVDFSGVPSDVLPIVTGVFARLLFDVQYWTADDSRTPIALMCDEAHLYLPVKDNADAIQVRAVESFERIAKEGRKYGVGLVVVSQRPSDVSRTILSQCNNFVVLRLTNEQDQNVVQRLLPDSMAGLTQTLPLLDTGEALVLGDAVLLPTRVKLDKPKVRPASGTREFWTEWNNKIPDATAITESVESMRRQNRSATDCVH